jgi:outer membrane protein OmpA-like peptidoglycan-associated protein
MSRKITFFIFFILLVFSTSLGAETLKWEFDSKDRLEVVKTAEISFFINKNLKSQYYERNIADLTNTAITENSFPVTGKFSIYTRNFNESVFKLTKQTNSQFVIKSNGQFEVADKQVMPNLRHIPSFPDNEVKKGESWTKNGQIVFDSFSIPFSLTMPVEYKLEDLSKQDGINIARISYSLLIDNTLLGNNYPNDFPARIVGKDNGVILWDLTNNQPLKFQNIYHIIFLFQKGEQITSYEWIMNINTDHTLYPHKPQKDKNSDINSLNNDEGITVDENERGIVIRLGEVLFDFDSAKIKDSTSKTLDNILTVIKNKYPDREIIVEGHTDNTGNPHYNQELSEKRARNIAEKVIQNLEHDKVSYIGHGEAKPIAPNETTEGRKKNRRVDIIIKLK